MQSDYMDPDIVQNLIDRGFSLAFHGHQHRPQFLDTRFRHGIDRRMTVISAGTLCGGPAYRFPRAYNVIEFDTTQRKGRLHLRTMQNDRPQLPIWGPGTLPPNTESHIDFDYDAPPIMRADQQSDMKVLTVNEPYQKLNNFQMFLAVSDRMVKREGEFLYLPHTTKLIWGAHRAIYIFTDATGELSLYYDMELKEPLQLDDTGGAMLPTTTIVTKNRIYIPVPKALEPAFQVAVGIKEFYVRFDTIP